MLSGKVVRTLIVLLFFFLGGFLIAQSIPNLSSMNVGSLNSAQIGQLLSRASAMGYSEQDILSLAGSQGLSSSDLSVLDQKIKSYKNERLAEFSSSPLTQGRTRANALDTIPNRKVEENYEIYGLNIFEIGSLLSFQTNQNISTPNDYLLGVGDQLFIDIYGASEGYYQVFINPSGAILIENIGPISLNGLTVDEASLRLKQKLDFLFPGLNTNTPNTFLNVSLGQVRSVSVNIVGQVKLPGTYTLSGLSTTFNALYAAGGVSELGTMREIQHFRKGKLISTIDVYQYIQSGSSDGDNRLENGDVIIVKPYTNRVILQGETKINGIFELKDGETVSSLIEYAGGFAENAFQKSIKLVRIQNGEKHVADIRADQYDIFTSQAGDKYTVSGSLNRYANRVVIKGAVFRPGNYSLNEGLTLLDLINKTEGLQPDAFRSRALIKRTNEDLSTETISFNLDDIMNGLSSIELQREDVVTIFSRNELKEESFVEVLGDVNSPGILEFSEGLTLDDAVLLAGGLSTSARGGVIEVSRRILSNSQDGFSLSETFAYPIGMDYQLGYDKELMLSAYDQVVVRENPNYKRQQLVSIEGQVVSPGQYAIKDQGERISDLLERAGGINQFAFVEGATLIRKAEFYDEPTNIEQQIDDLIELQSKFQKAPDLLTEGELNMINRIEQDIQDLERRNESNQSLSSFAKRERLKEVIERNGLTSNIQLKQAEAIGIDLNSILEKSGSVSDLLLEEGDVLVIPKKTETVRLRGKLIYPTTSRFVEGKSLKYYINNAGGFDVRAKKKGTYIVYANGEVARTKSFLFFKFYPKPEPGSEIIVPSRPVSLPIRVQDVLALTSSLATLALLVNQLNSSSN